MPKIGVIAGSGMYEIEGMEIVAEETPATPYGPPSAAYRVGRFFDGTEVIFLPRHGTPHEIPPHRVNYRANLFGFGELGVEVLLSISATGGINPDLGPGSLVLLDQIIDQTSGREATFYDGPEVVHVDFTEPFCERVRRVVKEAADGIGLEIATGGTYLCTNGPRLESRAEIRMFRAHEADIVGMTAMPEAVLAREKSICLAGISVVTNPAAGLAGRKLTTDEVVETMGRASENLKQLLTAALPPLNSARRTCACPEALKNARL